MKQSTFDRIDKLYNSNLSLRKNLEHFKAIGEKVSCHTLKEYNKLKSATLDKTIPTDKTATLDKSATPKKTATPSTKLKSATPKKTATLDKSATPKHKYRYKAVGKYLCTGLESDDLETFKKHGINLAFVYDYKNGDCVWFEEEDDVWKHGELVPYTI